MSGQKLDGKLLVLLGLALVGGLFGARSMLGSAQVPDSVGFDGPEPLAVTVELDSAPPLDFESPVDPRNPFMDERTEISGSGAADSGEQGTATIDPALDESTFEG